MVQRSTRRSRQRFFLYAKNLLLRKLDETKPDPQMHGVVQPVMICDSVMSIVDELAAENALQDLHTEVTGPQQIVGKPKAAELVGESKQIFGSVAPL